MGVQCRRRESVHKCIFLFILGFPGDMEPTIFALGLACSQVLMYTLIIAKSIYSHISEDPPPPESKLCRKESNNKEEEEEESKDGRSSSTTSMRRRRKTSSI